jgi:hypothetical protein
MVSAFRGTMARLLTPGMEVSRKFIQKGRIGDKSRNSNFNSDSHLIFMI